MTPQTPGRGTRLTALPEDQERGAQQPGPGRPAFPGAVPPAPAFEDEIHAALSYEKGLVVKAMVAIAIVAVVVAVRFLFLG